NAGSPACSTPCHFHRGCCWPALPALAEWPGTCRYACVAASRGPRRAFCRNPLTGTAPDWSGRGRNGFPESAVCRAAAQLSSWLQPEADTVLHAGHFHCGGADDARLEAEAQHRVEGSLVKHAGWISLDDAGIFHLAFR